MKVSARYPEKGKRPTSDRRRSPDRSRLNEGKSERSRQDSSDSYKRNPRRAPSFDRSRRLDPRRLERSISPRRRSPIRSSFQRNFRSKSPELDLRSRISERLYDQEKFPPSFAGRIEPAFSDYSTYDRMAPRYSPPVVENTEIVLNRHIPTSFESVQHFNTYEERDQPAVSWDRSESVVHPRQETGDWVYTNHRSELENKINWEEPAKPEEMYKEPENVLKFLPADENHPDIPVFDGKNPDLTSRQWTKIIDDIGFKENWSSEKRKFQMASKLAGEPKEWFIREDKLTNTWNKIKHTFMKAFAAEMDYFNLLQRMMNRVKLDTESYSNYFTYKTMLLNACSITGRKAVSCLIGGLIDDDLKVQCYDQNFSSSELLYGFLVQHEQSHKTTPKDARGSKYCLGCKAYQQVNHRCTQKPAPYTSHGNHDAVHLNLYIDVIINGYTLQGYNDLKCDYVTLREDQAIIIKLHYNKYKTKIQGHRGVMVETLGNINVLLRVGTAVVNMQVFVVPNSSQDYPVVIGESLRNHPEVSYYEDMTGTHFLQKPYQPTENTSFTMNEKLVMKMNDGRETSSHKMGNRKIKDRLTPRQKADPSGYTSRFDQQNSARIKYSKFR